MKKQTLFFVVFATLVLGMSINAGADVFLFTPPLFSPGGDEFGCELVNVTNSTLPVTLYIYRTDGALISSNSVELPAGNQTSLGTTQSTSVGHYCKFQAPKRSAVRAAAVIFGTDGRIIVALPAE